MSAIRVATEADVDAVQDVARSAGERFRAVADRRIARCADDPPPSTDHLLDLVEHRRLLVADGTGTADGSGVVGFVALEVVDGRCHVDEVSVSPEAQGRGLGVALLDAAQGWSHDGGLDGVTLTTFREVEWNRPFYERRGFVVLDAAELTPGLRRLIAHEATLGLDPELRVAMWRPPTPGSR